MKKILLFLLVSMYSILSSQTIINAPTINRYANVLAIDYCENSIDIPTGMASQYNVGDKILLVQMKGALLKGGNNPDNGQVDDYISAGNYEINEIKSINSGANDVIVFKYEIKQAYNPFGFLQIVNIPQYADVVFQNTLTCQAWDGTIGGILAFNATGTVTLNADINVSEKGFRGGIAEDISGTNCFGFAGYTGYSCAYTLECGAQKGEGIGDRYETKELARTPNANGGGGGNDHNAGGGGGGAFSVGGVGGDRTNGSCNGFGAFGGIVLDYNSSVNKIFMTGGGGAGDAGNAIGSAGGTSGGKAGGLVFVTASSITSNGNKIISNGQTVTDLAIGDGAGGGGAGGLVVLDINTYNDALIVENIGGKGGNVQDDNSCPGPGGGGSGGILWLSQSTTPANINLSASGGASGFLTIMPCMNATNGALPGGPGGIVYDFPSNVADKVFEKMQITSAGTDTVICGDGAAPLFANTVGSQDYNFLWLWSTGTESEKVFDFKPEDPGKYDVTATTNYSVNGQNCQEVYIVKVEFRKPKISIVASSFGGDTIKPNEPVFLNAVVKPLNPNYVYEWTPADRIEPNNERNAIATALLTEKMCLKVTDEFGCANQECVDVYVYEPYIKTPNAFSPNNDGLNDEFIPLMSEDLEVVSFKVYSRWGDLVYKTKENKAWDGKKKGKDLPPELYIWHLTAKQKGSDAIFERQGNVSIVR